MTSKKSVLLALLLGSMGGSAFAGNFSTYSSYTIGDVLLCFRNGGANDLVVDAGPISTFTNLAPNARYTITAYTGTQLSFVGTNSVIWSAFAGFDDSVPAALQYSLFMTKPRTAINTKSTPWTVCGGSGGAGQSTEQDIFAIALGATDNLIANYNNSSTSTAVVEPDDSTAANTNPNYKQGISYGYQIGQAGDFIGDFGEGDVENTTPKAFITSATVARSDFYQIPPNGILGFTPAVFLGYFELSTNGSMTYVAYPTASLTVPVIKSIGRTNNVTSVTFTTGPSGTYSLRGISGAGLSTPRLSWPVAASVAGDGAAHTLTDTTTSTNKFYVITAQ